MFPQITAPKSNKIVPAYSPDSRHDANSKIVIQEGTNLLRDGVYTPMSKLSKADKTNFAHLSASMKVIT